MIQVPPKRELDKRSEDAWGVADRIIESTLKNYGPPPLEISRRMFNRLKQAFMDKQLPGEMYDQPPATEVKGEPVETKLSKEDLEQAGSGPLFNPHDKLTHG